MRGILCVVLLLCRPVGSFLTPGAGLSLPYTLSSSFLAPPPSSSLQPTLEVHSSAGVLEVVLTVRAVEVSLPRIGPHFSYATRAFCVDVAKGGGGRCGVPAPTLTVRPGDVARVTLVNELNVHPSNETSFELRGGVGTIFRGAPQEKCQGGGASTTYSFNVSSTAAPGVYWYTSGGSGGQALSIMSGLVGALVVLAANETASLPLDASYARTVLVMTHVMLGRNPAEKYSWLGGNSTGDDDESLPQLALRANSSFPATLSSSSSPRLSDAWLVNGQYQPTLSVQPRSWLVLDLLALSSSRLLEIEVRTALGYGQGQQACDMLLLSLGGSYLSAPRRVDGQHLVLLSGSRATIALSCPAGTHYVQSVSTSSFTSRYAGVGSAKSKTAQLLLTVLANSGKNSTSAPPSADTLAALQSNHPVVAESKALRRLSISTEQAGVSSQSRWLGAGTDCSLPCFTDESCTAIFGVNYSARSFPTSRLGKCAYESPVDGQDSRNLLAVEGEDVELTIWGRGSSAVPIYLSMPMQLVSFLPAAAVYRPRAPGQSSYLEPAADRLGDVRTMAYSPPEPDRASAYGQPGDWLDVVPALAGKTVLRGRLSTGQGFLRVSGGGLDFDRGMQMLVKIVAPSFSAPPSAAVAPNMTTPVADMLNYTPPAPQVVQGGTMLTPSQLAAAESSPLAFSTVTAADASLGCDAMGRSWGYRESVDLGLKVRTIEINGCPNHYSVCQAEVCGGDLSSLAFVHPRSAELPLYPQLADTPTDTTCSTEAVGFAVNGVGIFGPATTFANQKSLCLEPQAFALALGGASSVASSVDVGRQRCSLHGVDDALLYCGDFIQDAAGTIDACGGSSDERGRYGYRVAPACLLRQLSSLHTAPFKSSPQVGWALDGFPIFGPLGPHGVEMLPCGVADSHPTLCLDRCNGLHGPLPTDRFLYRYFLAGAGNSGDECSDATNVGTISVPCQRETHRCCASQLPDKRQSPYSIGCLAGCIPGRPCNSTLTSAAGIAEGDGESYQPLRDRPTVPTVVYEFPHSSPFSSPESSPDSTLPTMPGAEPEQQQQQQLRSAVDDAMIEAAERQIRLRASLASTVVTKSTSFSIPGEVVVAPAPLLLVQTLDREMAFVNSSSSGGFRRGAAVQPLPSGSGDAVIFGLGAGLGQLFFSTALGVQSASQEELSSAAVHVLIAGLLRVDVFGFNFGQSRAEVYGVTVRGRACGSLVRVNGSHLQCLLTQTGFLTVSPDESDASLGLVPSEVYVTAQGGDAHGPYAVPETVVMSRSGQPVISRVEFTVVPFRAHAIFLLPAAPATARPSASLYFSSTRSGGGCGVYRSLPDGSQVEFLVAAESVYSVAVAFADCHTGIVVSSGRCDFVVFTQSGGVSAIVVPAIEPSSVFGLPQTSTPLRAVLSRVQTPGAVVLDLQLGLVLVSLVQAIVRLELDEVAAVWRRERPPFSLSPASGPSRMRTGPITGEPGMTIVWTTHSDSRLGGLAMLPLAAEGSLQPQWSQQRLLAVDTNKQELLALTYLDNRSTVDALALVVGKPNTEAILWPTALAFDSSPSLSPLATASPSNVTIFVAELLGRVWRLSLAQSEDFGSASADVIYRTNRASAPSLIIDLSAFPASGQLRAWAYDAIAAGLPVSDRVLVDLLN